MGIGTATETKRSVSVGAGIGAVAAVWSGGLPPLDGAVHPSSVEIDPAVRPAEPSPPDTTRQEPPATTKPAGGDSDFGGSLSSGGSASRRGDQSTVDSGSIRDRSHVLLGRTGPVPVRGGISAGGGSGGSWGGGLVPSGLTAFRGWGTGSSSGKSGGDASGAGGSRATAAGGSALAAATGASGGDVSDNVSFGSISINS